MFSSLGLFKQLPCPGDDCHSGQCLFSHDILKPVTSDIDVEPPTKRRRLDIPSKLRPITGSPEPRIVADTSISLNGIPKHGHFHSAGVEIVEQKDASIQSSRTVKQQLELPTKAEKVSVKNETLSISNRSRHSTRQDSSKQTLKRPAKIEPLQPRTLANPPATHPVRFKLLLLIHEQFTRLNKLVAASSESSKTALLLSEYELIEKSLNEEQNAAISAPKVYANVLKNRIGALKKTDLKAWVAERTVEVQKQSQAKEQASKNHKSPASHSRIATGLTYKQEIQILPQLITPEADLVKHGYITAVPREADIEKAQAGVIVSNGFEVCDRCGCRFQVFSTQRESDGALTTGGSCRHHWGRLGPQSRGSAEKPIYSCCQLEQGQPGCEEKVSHVFKVSHQDRLAAVLQFEETPQNDREGLQPVCFDCEMAYTTYGMELIRLTAVAWPSGEPLLDILVTPLGVLLDLNTRFSGVSTQQWTDAKPWSSLDLPPVMPSEASKAPKPDDQDVSREALPIVPSPQHARSLLFQLINPSTPLIGHGLENDLIAVRIVHIQIVDTVMVYPHKRGLPLKNKLKFLARDEIKWHIQDSGVEGHDSLEDALAAGELVRHKIKLKWLTMKRDGWSFKGDTLCDPET